MARRRPPHPRATRAHLVGYIRCSPARQPVSLPDMDLCALVGRNVRRFRLAAGLTQEELAHRANLDRTYLSDIERGIRNPTVLLLRDIAAVLAVHPAVLLFEAHEAELVARVLLPPGSNDDTRRGG